MEQRTLEQEVERTEKRRNEIEEYDLHGAVGIPYGILSGSVGAKEIRILEAAREGFSFRLAEPLTDKGEISLHFYRFQESRYETLQLKDPKIIGPRRASFCYIYTVLVEERSYQMQLDRLLMEYSHYIDLKLNWGDQEMAKALSGFPAELEETHYHTLEEQRKAWAAEVQKELKKPEVQQGFKAIADSNVELALMLDGPQRYGDYLAHGILNYARAVWEKEGLSDHPLAAKRPERIYVGNQFCHFLFPEREQLWKILERAHQEKIRVTICFTYLRQEKVEETKELLQELAGWKDPLELVINDWGMLELVKEWQDSFELSLGVLLHKRRKDTRLPYDLSYQNHDGALDKTNTNSGFYFAWLREQWKIQRLVYESCGYQQKIVGEQNSLLLPYFQTNTSQYCTLYAVMEQGDRGCQSMPKNCPKYCQKKAFLYPSHLNMVGRGNSLFGHDDHLLKDPSALAEYLEQGIDRIVLNY